MFEGENELVELKELEKKFILVFKKKWNTSKSN